MKKEMIGKINRDAAGLKKQIQTAAEKWAKEFLAKKKEHSSEMFHTTMVK